MSSRQQQFKVQLGREVSVGHGFTGNLRTERGVEPGGCSATRAQLTKRDSLGTINIQRSRTVMTSL